MAGALNQAAAQRDLASPTNDDEDPGLPPGRALDLLDGATQRLLQGLMARGPTDAAAAAMLSQAPRGSLPGALGAGISADLATRLGTVGLPTRLRGEAARTQLIGEQARGAELQNRINELNFGYMTEPWDTGGGQGGGDLGPAGAGGPPGPAGSPAGDRITPAPVTPVQAGPGPQGAPGGAGGAPAAPVDPANPQQLPLMPESQARLAALHAQLRRAAAYINRSPKARQDYYALLEEMTKTVQEDPLAKQAITQQNAQQASDTDMVKQLHLKAVDIGQGAYDQSSKEAQALASAPNAQFNATDPAQVSAWIDNRARQIFAERFKPFAAQLRAMGQDPSRFLADVAGAGGAAPAPAAAAVAQPPGAPGGRAALPADLAAEMDQEQPAAAGSGSPAAAAAPAPSAAAPTAPAAGAGAPSPVEPRRLSPTEEMAMNKEQGEMAQTVNTLEQWNQNLHRALAINDTALAGPAVETGVGLHRIIDSSRGVLGMKRNDVELKATAQLRSILAGMSLQNLNTLIKGRFTNNELDFVQQLESSLDQSPGERELLLKQGLTILAPRIKFERMRMKAFNAGHPISPDAYQEWLESSYDDETLKNITGGGFVDPGAAKKVK